MNNVSLIGNLGKDVEVKQVGETTIGNFTLATSDGFGDRKKTNWHNITCFGKTAQIASKYLKKGSKCGIVGEIEYQSWDKDGATQYKTVIKCNKLDFLDSKQSGGQQSNGGYQQPQQNYQQPQQPMSPNTAYAPPQPEYNRYQQPQQPSMPIEDDSLPF